MGSARGLDLDADGLLAADVGRVKFVARAAEAAVATWSGELLGRRIFDC